MKKIVLGIVIFLVIAIASVITYLKFFLPDVEAAPKLQVQITPERVARGRYLAYHVSLCMDCHSTRDWTHYSGPIMPGTEGKGGEYFEPEFGFPGKYYSKNITPYNLKNWTDGEIFRAITCGVNKDGEAIFPVMPYEHYGKMDPEDVYSIIAFVRTLRPIETTWPDHSPDFPVSLLINTMPKQAAPGKLPPKTDTIAYGSYITNAAGCNDCHTPVENGRVIAGREFTGGREFAMPGVTVVSANLTPDPETGIGAWSELEFVERFKSYASPSGTPPVKKGGMQTVMPWSMFGGMDSTDLVAMYKYLKTLKPVKSRIKKFVATDVAASGR